MCVHVCKLKTLNQVNMYMLNILRLAIKLNNQVHALICTMSEQLECQLNNQTEISEHVGENQ